MKRFDPLDFDIFGFELIGSLEKPFDSLDRTMLPLQNELNNAKNLGGE